MPSNTYPLIAREGWPVLGLLLVAVVLANYYLGIVLTIVFAICLISLAFLLRDPTQDIPSLPLALVSPAHAMVDSIETVNDPWLERKAVRIRLRMSPLDIYSLRSPIEGKVVNQWSRSKDAENAHRKFAFWVKSDEDDDVVIAINLNRLSARLFRFYVHSGERIGHGQRCGFLYFGGIIDVYIPEHSKIKTSPGEHIASGSGILAQIVHTGAVSAVKSGDQSTSATG